MNISAVITASVFLCLSLAFLIYLFVGKGPLAAENTRMFYRASCGVYVSGALLILIFTLIMKGLPVAFVVISDVTILFVFCFTTGLIYFMSKALLKTAKKAEEPNDKKE